MANKEAFIQAIKAGYTFKGESVKIGAPMLAGATVTAKVISQGRHAKVKIFKMRRRKHYQKHQGHRQNFTEIEIGAIAA